MVIRIHKGRPTAEELAAVVTVLTALATEEVLADGAVGRTADWNHRSGSCDPRSWQVGTF